MRQKTVTKCDKCLLQNASGIGKCDSYWKVRRNTCTSIAFRRKIYASSFLWFSIVTFRHGENSWNFPHIVNFTCKVKFHLTIWFLLVASTENQTCYLGVWEIEILSVLTKIIFKVKSTLYNYVHLQIWKDVTGNLFVKVFNACKNIAL